MVCGYSSSYHSVDEITILILSLGKNEYFIHQFINMACLFHNMVFHTLLGLFEVSSEEHQPVKDVLQLARNEAEQQAEHDASFVADGSK